MINNAFPLPLVQVTFALPSFYAHYIAHYLYILYLLHGGSFSCYSYTDVLDLAYIANKTFAIRSLASVKRDHEAHTFFLVRYPDAPVDMKEALTAIAI